MKARRAVKIKGFQDGPHNTAWSARYMEITDQAPGKAGNVQRPGL
ncbi:hypothetical protein KIPE111705_14765 [Kibdelosporangium persicum]|nr:hypothetical protein [Kibdelosporangium persicum]